MSSSVGILDEALRTTQLDDLLVTRYFQDIDDRNLLEQAQACLNEYRSFLRKAISEDRRIDLLLTEVLGYELRPFHEEMLIAQEQTAKIGEYFWAMILGYRGSGKSTVSTVGRVIFEILCNPNIRILIASNTGLQSEVFLREIKAHFEQNQRIIDIFGNWMGHKWDSKEITVNTRTAMHRESTVTCIGVGGATASRHYDLILCCHPDTEIVTRRGIVPIKELESTPKLKVLGHDGKYHSVLKVHTRPYQGLLYEIRPYKSCDPIWVTPNHPILVKRFNLDGLPEVKFIKAHELQLTDKLPYPKVIHDSPHRISQRQEVNELLKITEFWRFLGYWYAEGSVCPGYRRMRLTFGTNAEEQAYIKDCLDCIEKVFGKRPNAVVTNNGTITQISLSDDRFEFLRDCGRLAHEKYLPYWIKQAHFPKLKQFLMGYWRGDGHFIKCINQNGLVAGFVSVSKSLLSDIRQCLLDFNISTSLRLLREADPAANVCGNIVSSKPTYVLTGDVALCDFLGLEETVDFESYQPSTYSFDDKFYYSGIRSIRTVPYEGEVYNLEVADAHTYCHDLIVSHNCDDLVDEENSRTPGQREKLRVWFYKSLLPTLMEGGRIMLGGTLWNPNDLNNYVMKNTPGLKPCIIKALDDRFPAGTPWPEKTGIDHFVALRRQMGVPEFESQYQMNTSAMEGKIFSYEMFQWYDKLPAELRKYQGVDLAISTSTVADFFAHATIGVDPETSKKYVIDVFGLKAQFSKQTETIRHHYYLHDPIITGVEANAYQAAQVHHLKEVDPELRLRAVFTDKDKVTRAMKLAARCSTGEILFRKDQVELIQQLLEMPDGSHDDLFDALDIAVKVATQGIRKQRTKEPGLI